MTRCPVSVLALLAMAGLSPFSLHALDEIGEVPPVAVPAEEPVFETGTATNKAFNPDYSKSVEKAGGPIATPASTTTGALSGKIVYLMAGHGWTYNAPGVWYTQRGLTNSMVEDFGNLDQVTIMADMLLNAGATVVPLRPFGIQELEVVIDNDDPTVTFAGSWSNSSATHFYGSPGDVPYRFTSKATGVATATATYNAATLIPAAGYYPVYVWTRWGTDRINQEYIVTHSGGAVSRRINHQRVGSGWIYLGTYHFEPGGPASVTITNLAETGEPGSTVIADAVRFGNGMGDASVEGEASGKPRHEENGRYWLAESRGIGSGLALSSSVGSPPRLATHMNYTSGANSGAATERVYLSFHSNAGGGRGADGLFNNNPGDSCTDPTTANSFTTPGGVDLAVELGTRVNIDMRAITSAPGNPFEFLWGRTGSGTNIFGSGCGGGGGFNAYGEITNAVFANEMAATIIEVAFHDNASDAALMRDPKAREAIARANLHGLINFFNAKAGSLQAYPPEQPGDPSITSDAGGNLTLRWTAPPAGGPWGAGGEAATGYVVEVSTNGRGFAPAQVIANGGTLSADVTAHVPIGQTRYFRVVATNPGGHSFPSITVGARRSAGRAPVLVVNGFDRYERRQNYRQTESAYLGSEFAGGGTFERVIPRFNNRFDYVTEYGAALDAADVAFDSCQNEHIISGDITLTDYSAVYWILGNESTADSTFNATEQTRIAAFLAANGNLFLSGSEIAWDLGRTAASTANKNFLQNTLRVTAFTNDAVQDDADTYSVTGTVGGPFAGIGLFTFSDGSDIHGDYDVAFPDQLVPRGGATTVLTYSGGNGGSAAIAYDGSAGNNGRIIFLGFPFETITSAAVRSSIIAASTTYFQTPARVVDWMAY